MVGISLLRILQTALKNLWRNVWLSVATTVIMTITLLMMSFLYFANVLGAQALQSIEQKVDLLVNFKENVQQQYVEAVAQEMRSREDVAKVTVVSADDALANFRRLHNADSTLEDSLQELEDNPLPASIYIVATEPRFYANIAKQLEAEKYTPFIEEVKYENSKLIFDRLIRFIATTRNVGITVTTIFSILVIMIMFNTVRLAIYSFREEIDIMRLVGASRWFIQGPFIIEAVLVAILAVVISVLIQYPTLKASAPYLQTYFFDNQSDPFNLYTYIVEHAFTFVGLQLLLAVSLAFFSSLIAVRRYLRET